MKTVILSAFGQFGNYQANTTELVARKLHGTCAFRTLIESIVFPCAIPEDNRGGKLFNLATEKRASGIICLGMSSEKKGFCIESVARNVIDSKYCAPQLNGTRIDLDLPMHHKLEVNLEPWNVETFCTECKRLDIGKVEISENAGAFCCNHLIFQLQTFHREHPDVSRIPFIFIHVPCSEEAIEDTVAHTTAGKIIMSTEQVARGIQTLIGKASLS